MRGNEINITIDPIALREHCLALSQWLLLSQTKKFYLTARFYSYEGVSKTVLVNCNYARDKSSILLAEFRRCIAYAGAYPNYIVLVPGSWLCFKDEMVLALEDTNYEVKENPEGTFEIRRKP